MGHHADSEAEGEEAGPKSVTWVCTRSVPPLVGQLGIFDHDMNGVDGWTCTTLDQLETSAKTAYYIVRLFQWVRERLPPVPPP